MGMVVLPVGVAAQDGHEVLYEGVPAGLESKLKIIASLEDKNRQYPTTTSLRRAASRDSEAFETALKSAGYYIASVRVKIEPGTDDAKSQVIFSINSGPAFQAVEHRITYAQERTSERPLGFSDLDLEVDSKADGASLKANQQAFLYALWENGYPAARILDRYAEANLEAGTAVVSYEFDSGAKALFGDAVVTGLNRTREDYIRKLVTWNQGELYRKSEILAFRDSLAATGLFNATDVAPGTTGLDGDTPILVSLTERKHRTIGAGISFSTSEGPGVRVFYENRNLFKRAERFRIDLEASQIEQSARFLLEKPLVALPGALFLQGSFANQTTDAFDARTIDFAGGVAKFWFDRKLETRGGLAVETSSISPANGDPDERTFFISLPLSISWDNEDDLLNPTKGVRASLSVIPYTGAQTFTQIEANVSTRVAFGKEKKFITAFRTRLGSTLGNDLLSLPINKRFYSGGGGSVRGYGFQLVGNAGQPVIDEETGELTDFIPAGARSVIEGAFEARYAVTSAVQVAAFIDAGSISADSVPDFSEEFFVGVGGGARYLTPVGPLRVDIAFPLNRREFDNSFQFLISLGQAF